MNFKKVIKIVLGAIVFLTLPSLLGYGFIYFKYNEDLPQGVPSEQADALANKMLEALDYEAFKETDFIEWTFKNRHHYKWDKYNNICTVLWKEHKVDLHLNYPERSKAYIHSFNVVGDQRDAIVQKALDYFNNDSFWLVAPYKVFDPGVERSIVNLENGNKGLLVTYTSGGSTPGDSYLWQLDANGKPESFKMWTSILPIDGIEASWSDWVITDSGAQLPTFHKILFLGLELTHVKAEKKPYLRSKPKN